VNMGSCDGKSVATNNTTTSHLVPLSSQIFFLLVLERISQIDDRHSCPLKVV